MNVPNEEKNGDSSELPIAIIGGGLAGLSLANGFNRVGVKYKIYEATEKFSEIGAGISFLPNAIQALNLIDPGLLKSFDDLITYDEDPEVGQLRIFCGEKEIQPFKFGDEIIGLDKFNADDRGRCGARRARLLDKLIEKIPPDAVEFNKKMLNITEVDGRVDIQFTDGTQTMASAAICCDGIKSGARALVLGSDDIAVKPRYAGAYAYRAVVQKEDAVRILGPHFAANGGMWVGFGRYLLHYPVDLGAFVNVLGVIIRHNCPWTASTLQEPCSKEDIRKDFAGFGDALVSMLETTNDPKRWGIFELPPVRTYSNGRICLAGDAAHAATSHQGAGGSGAFEDAYVLTELFGDKSLDCDVVQRLKGYDLIRCERGNRIVSSSRDQGDVFTLQQPEVRSDMDKFKLNLKTRYNWLWGVDLKGDVDRAKEFIKLGKAT